MLLVDNLSVHILTNIAFSLERGENLTILGANGSGKTTLAKALCGLIASERVYCDATRVITLSSQKRGELFHFVPAKLHLYDEYLTVGEYLALSCQGEEKTVEPVLRELGILHLMDARCTRLSSGESTLMMVAGAVLRRSRYTILDEPTANLDAKNSVKLFALLKHSPWFDQKIIVTHDLSFAYALGSPILYLEEGKERFFGSCEAFFAPEHLETCFNGSIIRNQNHFMVNYQ